jgi:hypothetical protein
MTDCRIQVLLLLDVNIGRVTHMSVEAQITLCRSDITMWQLLYAAGSDHPTAT